MINIKDYRLTLGQRSISTERGSWKYEEIPIPNKFEWDVEISDIPFKVYYRLSASGNSKLNMNIVDEVYKSTWSKGSGGAYGISGWYMRYSGTFMLCLR